MTGPGYDDGRLSPLPVRPRPATGEPVSSYVRRLAAANHLRPSYLRGYLAGPPSYLHGMASPAHHGRQLLLRQDTIVAMFRAGGLVAGACWVQVVPSQVQVSPRMPCLFRPPNRTTVLVAAS
jgi:hypothetical protein